MKPRPVVPPLPPCGRYSSRDLARAALLSALLRDSGGWGEPLATRWGQARGLVLDVVRELLGELVEQGRVDVAGTPGCLRWRARRAA